MKTLWLMVMAGLFVIAGTAFAVETQADWPYVVTCEQTLNCCKSPGSPGSATGDAGYTNPNDYSPPASRFGALCCCGPGVILGGLLGVIVSWNGKRTV